MISRKIHKERQFVHFYYFLLVTASSPERESVLRQGIAALIRAAESPQNPTKTKV